MTVDAAPGVLVTKMTVVSKVVVVSSVPTVVAPGVTITVLKMVFVLVTTFLPPIGETTKPAVVVDGELSIGKNGVTLTLPVDEEEGCNDAGPSKKELVAVAFGAPETKRLLFQPVQEPN